MAKPIKSRWGHHGLCTTSRQPTDSGYSLELMLNAHRGQ